MVRQFLRSSINRVRSTFSGDTLRNSPYLATVLISLLIFIIGINLFVELTADVKAELMGDFDKSVTDKFVAMRSQEWTRYFTFVTDVGDVNGYLVMLLITGTLVYFSFRKWKYVFQVVLVLFLATISNIVLKRVFNRARPEIEHLVSVKTLSYPSGHAMSSMAFYGFLIYLVYKLKIHFVTKILAIIVLSVLIISIGTSRIYLGVHFPSDVLGGWIAGALWVFFCILIFNLIEAFRRDPLT